MPIVEGVIPTFFVADVSRSVEWYGRVLQFSTVFAASDYAGVELGPARIHLALHSPPLKGACYLRLSARLDAYIAAIISRGGRIAAGLQDHLGYGMREATVRDPDGNDLYIGQPL